MRCPDCEKFVSYEMADPEMVQEVEYDNGNVSAEVRLVKQCADCGAELEETSIYFDQSADFEHDDEHEMVADADDPESTERTEGSGRYMKKFLGVSISYKIRCITEGCNFVYEGTLEDDVQASSFDSLV